jgi:hypothetical protein
MKILAQKVEVVISENELLTLRNEDCEKHHTLYTNNTSR